MHALISTNADVSWAGGPKEHPPPASFLHVPVRPAAADKASDKSTIVGRTGLEADALDGHVAS